MRDWITFVLIAIAVGCSGKHEGTHAAKVPAMNHGDHAMPQKDSSGTPGNGGHENMPMTMPTPRKLVVETEPAQPQALIATGDHVGEELARGQLFQCERHVDVRVGFELDFSVHQRALEADLQQRRTHRPTGWVRNAAMGFAVGDAQGVSGHGPSLLRQPRLFAARFRSGFSHLHPCGR